MTSVQKFVLLPLFCILGACFFWVSCNTESSGSSNMLELEEEFIKIPPPSGAVKEGKTRHVIGAAMQVVSANYTTALSPADLESYYANALKENGWSKAPPHDGDFSQSVRFCKGRLDADLDRSGGSGRYYFGVRWQSGMSFKTGCAGY